jgi:two-component system response regulator AtoC
MAAVDCTVTLRGEAGTGKKLAARAIHAGSMRKQQRFLAINCADFSRQELAGQLMGYTSGNLYDAIRNRSGIFSATEIGTLLIDQIDEMPADMQTQLLSILDASDGQDTESKMNIRILVATATDLEQRVGANSFDKGLYEHLKVFELTLPPLRERKDDIPPLCQYFFDKYRRELGKAVDSVAPEVVETLVAYDFPGNVQELEHIIERAVISADGKIVGQEHLPLRFKGRPESVNSLEIPKFLTIAELEKRYILEVLEACNGNKSKTAEILGISRAALWRKLKQFKAETPDQ